MNVKIFAICLYMMLIYWISLQFPSLHTLFFPTLGAFSLLFVSRTWNILEWNKIAIGAVLSSTIGTLLFYLHGGVAALFINTLLIIWLINKFKWNAPPILAVSFIPFFAHPDSIWVIPLSVCASLFGLLGTLLLVDAIEKKIVRIRITSKIE